MMITLVLSSNMKRMLKDNVLVRKLTGIETAGSLNILFTDKTGTLTKGELEVVGVMFGNLDYYKEKDRLKNNFTYYNLLKRSILSNTDCLYDENKKIWIGGNATDKALVNYFNPSTYNIKKLKEVPFDSKNKYSYTKVLDSGKEITYYKGAPEVLLNKCKYYILPNGKTTPFINKNSIIDVVNKYANMGIRVLMICIEKDNKYLMLHRTKKKNDINKDKWLGIGGKFEEGESPEECIVREVMEETGLKLNSYKLRTIVTYVSTNWETEYMYVFTSNDFTGDLIECDEGDLQWIDKKEVTKLNTWEGDKIFVEKLQKDSRFFTVKFEYDGDKLVRYNLKEY